MLQFAVDRGNPSMRLFSLPVMAGIVSIGMVVPAAVRAQSQDTSQPSSSQDSSVANAARRNRDKKKTASNPPKSTKVITDDDLDRKNFKPGQDGLNVGASPMLETEPPSAQAVASAEAADEAPEQQAKDAAEQDKQLAKLKLDIVEAEKGLDVAQRQLALDQDSFLSNPDHVHDVAGKAKLNDEKQDISNRQQEIERLKVRLAALEELKGHRKLERTQAPPPPTENPPSAPPQP
jgi:hypothetical protein